MELEKIKYQLMSNQLKTSIKLSKKQNEAYSLMANGKNIFLTGAAGSGKCLGKDTPVIMYNGEVKMIQDIKKGDQVMGDDSLPRNVLSTTSGNDNMYLIKTSKGDTYTVNSHHILTFQITKIIRYIKNKEKYILKWGDNSGVVKSKYFETLEKAEKYSKTIPNIIDIPIMECIEKNKSEHWRKYFQGVYKDIYFPEQYVELDPYILGLWLGKGDSMEHIDTDEKNSIYLDDFYTKNSFCLLKCNINDNNKDRKNFFRLLHSIKVFQNKHIPLIYKTNSREKRLRLLAGLIDSYGYLRKNVYEIIQKRKILTDDIYFLAKSLGYQVKINKHKKNSYKIFISGKISEIPVLITQKKASPNNEIENHMMSKIMIEPIEKGKYYGFELDGNHRFLLGNFIVTHNTACIKLFIKVYKQNKIMGITSTTGISALLFGGTTLHSFTGIGLGTSSVESIVKKIYTRPQLRKRWTDLEILIIDEISMLSPQLFDKLENIARRVRRNDEPFGGIQLILSGDFCQLPCINSDDFCFESKTWGKCIDHTVYLTEIMRQKDREFQECLNNIRIGLLPEKTIKLLNSRLNVRLKNEFGIKPTKLYSTNYSVDYINNKELDKLAKKDPDFYEYNMEFYVYPGTKNKEHIIEKYKKSCNAPDNLQLCIGAQVMLLWNLDTDGGLVNGSRGVVTNFINDVPVVKFLNGRELIIEHHIWEMEENDKKVLRAIQIPLKLAYCLTIHRSQGCSLDYAEIDLSNIFESGMAYVALSRVKSIKGLSIVGIDLDKIKAHPKAVEFYKSLIEK